MQQRYEEIDHWGFTTVNRNAYRLLDNLAYTDPWDLPYIPGQQYIRYQPGAGIYACDDDRPWVFETKTFDIRLRWKKECHRGRSLRIGQPIENQSFAVETWQGWGQCTKCWKSIWHSYWCCNVCGWYENVVFTTGCPLHELASPTVYDVIEDVYTSEHKTYLCQKWPRVFLQT